MPFNLPHTKNSNHKRTNLLHRIVVAATSSATRKLQRFPFRQPVKKSATSR